jgi:hypothetical protein
MSDFGDFNNIVARGISKVGDTVEPDGGGDPSRSQKTRSSLTVFGPLGGLQKPRENSKAVINGLSSILATQSGESRKSKSAPKQD